MSLFDLLPEPIRALIPSQKRKDEREKLKGELDHLQEELKKEKEAINLNQSEEDKTTSDAKTTQITESIDKIRFMLADSSVPWYNRFMKAGFYILPIVLSYFLALYLRDQGGLELEHEEVIHPIGFYQMDDGEQTVFKLTDAYTSRFWNSFPPYYFTPSYTRTPDTSTFFFDQENAFIETKLILKNTSSSFNQMISTLHVEISKTEEPGFPWHELNTTPELERVTDEEFFEIRNVGAAPALDPELIYSLSDSVSKRMSFDPLYADESINEYIIPELEDYELADINYNDNTLDEFFYVHHQSPTQPEEQTFETINGATFRVIQTPDDLKSVTEVIETNQLNMNFKYTSVKQEAFDMNWQLKLDSTLYYFNHSDNLLTRWEAENYADLDTYEPMYPDTAEDGVVDFVDKMLEDAYTALGNEPEFHPEGVSLISEKITVDVHDLALGDVRSGFVNPDQILNPDGYVIIYLKLKKPTHGTYKIAVKANSEDVSEVYLETLIPEETEFIYPESLRFFESKNEPISE